MAVESFIPIKDVKNTTEKQVLRKPTIAELTTVDTPGKPSPAIFLEDKKPIKKKERIKEPVEKKDPNTILIITEKPQAALKIATSLGKPIKHSEESVPYYEVIQSPKTIYIASAVGHLFGLTYVKGQRGWPIFDIVWQPSYENKSSSFTRKYYNVLKKLSQKSSEFIVATDFDIEGEVIGWNILRFICKQKNAKRMKFSTLTSEELRESYENPLVDLAWGSAYAGEARHVLDWLYGINLSRALMSAIKSAGSFRILSIGRVQGPALKIIIDREKEILKFKSQPYWQIFAIASDIIFKHTKDIFQIGELEKFKKIKTGIAKTEKKEEKLSPPHPFDLTTLQKEAYRLFKINPSETLSIAQKLYLDGLISYPRTSSQKIPDAIQPKKIIESLRKHFPEAEYCTRKQPVEGKKTDPAHPSIYPTGEFKALDGKDEKLYKLIIQRFFAAFAEDATLANKKITLTANGIPFTANAQQIVHRGWLSFYPVKIEENNLPDINGKINIDKIDIQEKETQPPYRYTPTSLISILEKKNLGTKATRSMIVETLFDRGYLEGTSIKATPLGMKLIESLEKYSPIIIDENLTRQFEEKMLAIQESHDKNEDLEKKEEEIISEAKKIIENISNEFKKNELKIGQEIITGIQTMWKNHAEASTLITCPACKSGSLRIMYSKKTKRYFIACNKYPECKQVYSLPPNALIKKSEKNCEADGFPKLLAIRKGKRPWEFCFNPQCPLKTEKAGENNNSNN